MNLVGVPNVPQKDSYMIVFGGSFHAVAGAVNQKWKEGYRPVGGIYFGPLPGELAGTMKMMFCQALAIPDDADTGRIVT